MLEFNNVSPIREKQFVHAYWRIRDAPLDSSLISQIENSLKELFLMEGFKFKAIEPKYKQGSTLLTGLYCHFDSGNILEIFDESVILPDPRDLDSFMINLMSVLSYHLF